MSTTTPYMLHGLRISSEVMLPDATPGDVAPSAPPVTGPSRADAAGGAGPTDLRIDLLDYRLVGAEPPPGTVILDHHVDGARRYVAARAGDLVTFRVPGHADIEVAADLSRIACMPDPRVAPGHLPIILTGTVLPFILALAGHAVLHAGAVEVADGAIAVVDPSGVETSTLTAWLCAAGAPLVTDEVLRLDDDGACHRGGRQVRLRDHARSLVAGRASSHRALRRTVDGRDAVRPPISTAMRLPLRAVVLPRPVSSGRALTAHALDTASATMTLGSVPRILGWRVPGPRRGHISTVAHVARQIGVHVVDVPWGPPFDTSVPHHLLELLGVGLPDGVAATNARQAMTQRPSEIAPA